MSGFITIHREAFEHPLLRNGDRFRAWFWMVSKACWKPTQFDVKGKVITLQRGQFCASRDQIAKELGWSPSAVERFLTRLETEQMIGRETGQGKSIITIRNYGKYQDRDEQPGQETGQETGQQSDRDRTAKEQGNKRTSIGEEAKASPPRRAKAAQKFAMTPDWVPGPLPQRIAELVAQWPPGRLNRVIEDTRAYWIERGERRPGWDRTLHSRIEDVHDKIMRETRNGQPHRRDEQHLAPSGRPMGRTEAAARVAALRLAGTPAPAGSGGERLSLPLPDALCANGNDDGRPHRVADGRA